MLAAFTGVTDPGRRRRRNEDAYVAVPPLFAIADGMGGAQAGEVASGLAAAVLEEATGDERGEVDAADGRTTPAIHAIQYPGRLLIARRE